MRPILMPLLFGAALIAGAFAGPAMAETAGSSGAAANSSDRVNMVIVYGDDPCPRSTGDEITVCARKDEGERFRIPPGLRESTSPQNVAWTNRVQTFERVGATGTQSCSPVGAGGFTGCTTKLIQDAYAEKKAGTDVHFAEMIAKERAKREATTDANAAAAQADVEAAEKAYDARERAKAEAAAAASAATPVK